MKKLVLISMFAGLTANAAWADEVSLNIDFGTTIYGTPSSSYGAYANQSGVWNAITSTGSTGLVDLSGAALPGVTVNLSSSVDTGGFVGPLPNLSADDQALIGDNFYAILTSWTVTLSGLQNGLYNLYVYAPANNVVPTSSYIVNGVTEANLQGQEGLTTTPLTLGVNYAIDSVSVTDGSIVINSGGDAGIFSGLAGLQLAPGVSPVPGPVVGAGLPGLMMVGVWLLGWWKQKRTVALTA